jgi:membrane fusion protein (multidrug efflux system)
MSNETKTPAAPAASARRKRWLIVVIAAFVAIGIAYGAYWAIVLRYEQSTDDAYVSGNVVQITPQISGTLS